MLITALPHNLEPKVTGFLFTKFYRKLCVTFLKKKKVCITKLKFVTPKSLKSVSEKLYPKTVGRVLFWKNYSGQVYSFSYLPLHIRWLIAFLIQNAADEFYREYQRKHYNMLESEVCSLFQICVDCY